MFAILPILSFIVLWICFVFKKTPMPTREAFLEASVLWSVVLIAITELTSFFHLFTSQIVGFLWFVILATILVLIKKSQINILSSLKISIGNIKNYLKQPVSLEHFLALSIIFILLVTGCIALVSPPNNWDSMIYHMSRVVHWIQNGSVHHYPTNINRQLFRTPWSEFVIANFQILSDSDRFANFVQWLSFVGCIINVSLIVKILGGNIRQQFLAATFSATIPMAVLQSSSTQTDLVASFWILTFIFFSLRKNTYSVKNSFLIGFSLGLAILTKETTLIYIFPFFIFMSIFLFKETQNWKIILICILIIGICSILIPAGHYLRNFELYKWFLHGAEEFDARNELFSFGSLISNLLRNSALHIASGYWGIDLNVNNFILKLHNLLNVNDNSRATTYFNTLYLGVAGLVNHEDKVGNPVHFWFAAISLSAILFSIKSFVQYPNLKPYTLCAAITFVLITSIFKWSPWASRAHLPFFIICSCFVGITLEKFLRPKILGLICILLIVSALKPLLLNISRPILSPKNIFNVPRTELYFVNRSYLLNEYQETVQEINQGQCVKIGLKTDVDKTDPWEYPFWVLMKNHFGNKFRIEHVQVKNPSNKIKLDQKFDPCMIISLNDLEKDVLYDNGVKFNRIRTEPHVSLYQKQ